MSLLQTSDDQKIYVHLLRPGTSVVEAYHLARLLGYTQQHAIRKQVLTDWRHDFEEGVDYEMCHDPDALTDYESRFRDHFGMVKIVAPSRGRIFLTWSGLQKVFGHTTKDCKQLEKTLARFFSSSPNSRLEEKTQIKKKEEQPPLEEEPAPLETLEELETPSKTYDSSSSPDSVESSSPEEPPRKLSRWHQYKILEQLIDHLKGSSDPVIRRLALMSAETGLGRELKDIREMLFPRQLEKAPDLEPVVVSSSPAHRRTSVLSQLSPAHHGSGLLAQPFDPRLGLYYGLKQIGEKAGGYSAVQAGKAADLVAARMGYTHDDIRKRKLSFNDLPQLPDSTSGKLRRMYRFDADFSNQVVAELRANPDFEAAQAPDIGEFGDGGHRFPKLSRGPFDD